MFCFLNSNIALKSGRNEGKLLLFKKNVQQLPQGMRQAWPHPVAVKGLGDVIVGILEPPSRRAGHI